MAATGAETAAADSRDDGVVLAAGFIVFRELPLGKDNNDAAGDDVKSTRQYLLLHSRTSGNWTPPKGRMDAGEKSLLETAEREVEEETGLKPSQYEATTAFEKRLKYVAHGKPKEAVYWLARLKTPSTPITISEEHVDFRWVEIEEAKRLAARESIEQLLSDADDFILSPASPFSSK